MASTFDTQESSNIQIANCTVKPQGINFDKNLKFDIHVESICHKANRKLNALGRIVNYMELPKNCSFTYGFFKSHFNYCPNIWMFHSCTLNNKVNRLHERCLRIIYNNKISNFEELCLYTP